MAYDPEWHRLVFIGGLHRSGTTLFGRLLAEHPLVSGFSDTGVPADEGQHLQSVYPPALAYGGPGRFAFATAAHLTEASKLVSEENAERLLAAWSPHWNLERRFLVEKSPPNLIRARFLQALFPEATFLIIVRHPAAVSLATQKWSKTSLSSLLRHWLLGHEILEGDRPRLERMLVLGYEELVQRPGPSLASVQAFLGLDPRSPALEVRADGNAQYFDEWRARRVRASLLARRFEGRVARFGYSLRDLDHEPEP